MTVIHKMTSLAPKLAVFGIRNRTATMVSNTPDPSRNTGCDINPWTACDICVNRATDCGIPANLAKMAAYRRFTDTNSRMANSPNLLPIKSRVIPSPFLSRCGRQSATSLFTFHALCKQVLWSGARTDLGHEPRKDVCALDTGGP